MDNYKKAKESLAALNEELKKMGMLRIELVDPKDCTPQERNARYFPADKMNQLISNVKQANALESVPLCFEFEGKYKIISGHHRIDAAKAAGLPFILIMIAEPQSEDEIISKQLSHNELTGLDDKVVLAQLFNSIQDINQRLASGLSDEVGKISYSSLSFKIGTFKELTILFIPPDIEFYDSAMEKFAETIEAVKPSSEFRVTSLEYYDMFAKALRKVKKAENIKSNGTAVIRMVELAMEKMNEMEALEKEQEVKE